MRSQRSGKSGGALFLCRDPRLRPGIAGRCIRARLSSHCRGADLRHPATPEEGPQDQDRVCQEAGAAPERAPGRANQEEAEPQAVQVQPSAGRQLGAGAAADERERGGGLRAPGVRLRRRTERARPRAKEEKGEGWL